MTDIQEAIREAEEMSVNEWRQHLQILGDFERSALLNLSRMSPIKRHSFPVNIREQLGSFGKLFAVFSELSDEALGRAVASFSPLELCIAELRIQAMQAENWNVTKWRSKLGTELVRTRGVLMTIFSQRDRESRTRQLRRLVEETGMEPEAQFLYLVASLSNEALDRVRQANDLIDRRSK